MEPLIARIGFVTVDEYRDMFPGGPALHETCEAKQHEGQGIPSVAILALNIGGSMGLVWGVCRACFKEVDDDLGDDSMFGMFHLQPGTP